MNYELDSEGYISKVFFGCTSGQCSEYTGAIPGEYDSLGEWAESVNIQAYKVVDNTLIYDFERDKKISAEYAKNPSPGAYIIAGKTSEQTIAVNVQVTMTWGTTLEDTTNGALELKDNEIVVGAGIHTVLVIASYATWADTIKYIYTCKNGKVVSASNTPSGFIQITDVIGVAEGDKLSIAAYTESASISLNKNRMWTTFKVVILN